MEKNVFLKLCIICAIVMFCACQDVPQSPGMVNGSTDPIDPFQPNLYKDKKPHTFSVIGEDNEPSVSCNGIIAFSSSMHSVNPHIYAKPIAGTSVTQKTNGPSSDIQPAFSPDGKKIAFASDRNGNWDIFIINTENPNTIWQVTSSDADELHPSWSPDGNMLVYCAKSSNENWDLWIVELQAKSFTNLGPGLFPEWCPVKDSKKILFQKPLGRDGHQFALWTVDTDGNNLTEIISSAIYASTNPSWSPDGKWIAFTMVPVNSQKSTNMDIHIISIDGIGMVPLIDSSDPEWHPSWAPDGRIYYITKKEGKQNVWSVQPDLP